MLGLPVDWEARSIGAIGMTDHITDPLDVAQSVEQAERCECGADMVALQNGQRICDDTLRKFELANGRAYRPCALAQLDKPCA